MARRRRRAGQDLRPVAILGTNDEAWISPGSWPIRSWVATWWRSSPPSRGIARRTRGAAGRPEAATRQRSPTASGRSRWSSPPPLSRRRAHRPPAVVPGPGNRDRDDLCTHRCRQRPHLGRRRRQYPSCRSSRAIEVVGVQAPSGVRRGRGRPHSRAGSPIVLAAADRGEPRQPRWGDLLPGSTRSPWGAVPSLQDPYHAGGCRGRCSGSAPQRNEAMAPVQDGGRSADHPGGSVPPAHQHRRAPAAVERAHAAR